MTQAFRIDLPDDQAARFQSLAACRATTPGLLHAEVAQGLLVDAAALESWIAEDEADADAGRTVPSDDVMPELHTIIARAAKA